MVVSRPAARRRLENYAYLVKKYCADAAGNTCGPDADLETIRAQAPLPVSAPAGLRAMRGLPEAPGGNLALGRG